MMKDLNRHSRTLTPKGFAKLIMLAVGDDVYTSTAQDEMLTQMIDVFGGAVMPLGMNERPNASAWCQSIADELSEHRANLVPDEWADKS